MYELCEVMSTSFAYGSVDYKNQCSILVFIDFALRLDLHAATLICIHRDVSVFVKDKKRT